jgi:hypothetical protein
LAAVLEILKYAIADKGMAPKPLKYKLEHVFWGIGPVKFMSIHVMIRIRKFPWMNASGCGCLELASSLSAI